MKILENFFNKIKIAYWKAKFYAYAIFCKPIFIRNPKDIYKAECSGDLSAGVRLQDQFKLPSKFRKRVATFVEYTTADDRQILFFPQNEPATRPLSEKRQALRQDVAEKAQCSFDLLNQMNIDNSALLQYMQLDLDAPSDKVSQVEKRARTEFYSLVLHQYDKNFPLNENFFKALDELLDASTPMYKFFSSACLKKQTHARTVFDSCIFDNVTDYELGIIIKHHSSVALMAAWKAIQALRVESRKSSFQAMLKKGNWSPVGFLLQIGIYPAEGIVRVTTRETDLGGVLPKKVGPGRMVVFKINNAENSDEFFVHNCSGRDFVMNILTFLVDRTYPNIRKIEPGTCPYKKSIERPLY